MTDNIKPKTAKRKKAHPAAALIVLALLVSPAFLFPKELSSGVLFGLCLSFECVIPSVFPFFVIADAIASFGGGIEDGMLGRLFSKIFRLPARALEAFVLGNVCGFPLGVKAASDLYERGEITKKEAEHLIGFANGPSLAFTLGAVGTGMLGSVKYGFILYSSLVISSATVGFLFRSKSEIINKPSLISRQKFDLVSSIKNAGFNSVTVSSYIIFFSAVSALLRSLIKSEPLALLAVVFSEVSGAAAYISSAAFLPPRIGLALMASALAFSGFSVHLQSRSLAHSDISFIKYYIMKAVQAPLCAALTFLLSFALI